MDPEFRGIILTIVRPISPATDASEPQRRTRPSTHALHFPAFSRSSSSLLRFLGLAEIYAAGTRGDSAARKHETPKRAHRFQY